MDFRKVVVINHPTVEFSNIELSEAQIESIILAGLSTPIPVELYKKFHITFYKEQENKTNSGPVNIVISLKDGEEFKEAKYLFAGMIMGQMQLAATNLLLGYAYVTEEGVLADLAKPEQKEMIGIPANYTPIQQLRLGYPAEEVREREFLPSSKLLKRFLQ